MWAMNSTYVEICVCVHLLQSAFAAWRCLRVSLMYSSPFPRSSVWSLGAARIISLDWKHLLMYNHTILRYDQLPFTLVTRKSSSVPLQKQVFARSCLPKLERQRNKKNFCSGTLRAVTQARKPFMSVECL